MINLIGNTPIVRLNKIEGNALFANVYAKLEMFNPSGSIKVRIAKTIILNGIEQGLIKPNTLIVEATSGNTGVGLAFICSCLDLKFIAVMPENMSIERRKLIQIYGGKVVLTPEEFGMSGAVEKVKSLKKENEDIFIVSQFENKLNPLTHETITGPEVYKQMKGNIDILVCGIGTGGTITGLSRYLKSCKDIKVYGVEPASSPVLTKGEAGKHIIEGIGANFIPKVLDLNVIDEVLTIEDDLAYYGMKMLAEKEGIFAGISSGAALMGALELAKKSENKNKNIVVILPDTGERYLSLISDSYE